jgi:chromatin remodeling complex protein RSC6
MEWQSEIRNEARNMMNKIDDWKMRVSEDNSEEARSARNALDNVNEALRDVVNSVVDEGGESGGLFS